MPRKDVSFKSEGARLAGWLQLPEAGAGPLPCVVMAHGFSAVKEQYLDRFAETFAAAGLASLVFDHRGFGASGGEPRQEIDPWEQVRGYRDAVTFARTLPEVDRERIGAWGTSYSGGHVLIVGAIDRRVRCVVSQVPHISGSGGALRRIPPQVAAAAQAHFDADREARFLGAPPQMIAMVSDDDAKPCVFPGPKAWQLFQAMKALAPSWRNEVTLRSVEMARAYEPGDYIDRLGPTPLLMIVADQDQATPTDLALDAFKRAREPKKLLLLKGEHFDAYTRLFSTTSAAAAAWFAEHLAAAR